MDLFLLDKDFVIIKKANFINLQWNRCYYEVGQFSVELPASEYVRDAVYVYTKDRPEVGIIQKREYADGYDGEVFQLSGYFYEYKLNDKITFPRYVGYGPAEDVAREIVERYKKDIPLLILGDKNEPSLGENIVKESTGDGLAKVLYDFLETQELSYKCIYNYEANTMKFVVWQGKDRTQSQDENSFVTFSESFRNIQKEKITIDSSNFKNYAVVIGNGKYEEGKQIEVDVDVRADASEYAQVLYVDKTGEQYDGTKQTQNEYKEQLRQYGLEALSKYNDVTNVTFDTIDRGLTYMKDYDLGDKCDVILDSIREAYTVRIIEIDEVFKQNVHSITLQFGNKIPSIYNKARR